MKKIKVSFHPLFFLFTIFLMLTGKLLIFINYLIVTIMHEYAHALLAKKLGYEIKNIKLLPFGVSLNLQNTAMEPKDEVLVALAGPALNFILYIFCLALWWMFPITYGYLYLFAYANLVTGIINLMPVFPMDGGRVLVGILSAKYKKINVKRFVYAFNIAFSVCLFTCFFVLIKYANFTLLFMAIFTLLAGFPMGKEELNYKILDINGIKKDVSMLKTKAIVVKEGTPLYKVFRHVSKNYYLVVYVLNSKDEVCKVLYESEILWLIDKGACEGVF